jgi:hypothetical protein
MSESTRTAEAATEITAKEKDKEPKDKKKDDYDPYCCTPPGGGTGPDTKP